MKMTRVSKTLCCDTEHRAQPADGAFRSTITEALFPKFYHWSGINTSVHFKSVTIHFTSQPSDASKGTKMSFSGKCETWHVRWHVKINLMVEDKACWAIATGSGRGNKYELPWSQPIISEWNEKIEPAVNFAAWSAGWLPVCRRYQVSQLSEQHTISHWSQHYCVSFLQREDWQPLPVWPSGGQKVIGVWFNQKD